MEADIDMEEWQEADRGTQEWHKADRGIIYPKLTQNTNSIYHLKES